MASIPLPEVLNSPSGEKYRILRRFGRSVFLALDITYGDDGEDTARAKKHGKGIRLVAVKFELKNVEHHRLHDRAHAYNSLTGSPGIPFVHCSGTTENCTYIILDLLGPSLEDMFKFCDEKFTLKTILLIADQALCRIQYIHSQSCAHGEIIPKNLVMGSEKFSNLLYLINPGSAKYPDANLNVEISFRDDLASLGYVLLHFAWPELSWEDLKSKPTEYLCQHLPEEFATYFNHIRSDETLSYCHLREIFHSLFCRMDFKEDYVFDWTIRKYQKLAEKAEAITQPEPLASGEDSSDQFSDFGDESSVGGEVTPSTDIGPQNAYDIAPQLESRTPSHDKLVAAVTVIYAGLFKAENKCIKVDKQYGKPRQADSGRYPELSSSECLDLINLHLVQLFEIHDVILVSQHPAGSLHNFALKKKLPTRMWRHGIQPLLGLLQDHVPESRSDFLSFLRLSYSIAALLFETTPGLKAAWIECLYELAHVFKNVDTEGRASWEKRIQYWKSLRDPAVIGILQADLSDVMSPDAFPVSTTKPCRIESGNILLQEKDVVSLHLSDKSLKLSSRHFTRNSSDRSYSLVATCRDMFFITATSFISSFYILRHEAQEFTWWGSSLQAQSSDPINFDSIPDFSPVLFLGSCLLFVCMLASFYFRSRLGRYHTYILILASIAGIFIGYILGIGVKLIIFGVIPWALWLSMILTTVGHWVSRRYWWRTRCVRTELGKDIV